MKLHRTAGASSQTLVIGEKTYTLRPLTVGLYAEMEAYVVAQREDPMVIAALACQKVPAQFHTDIWDSAMRAAKSARTVTAAEMSAFEQSIRGLAFKFWACLKTDHPKLTVDDALKLIEEAGEERMAELQARIHVGSGEADLKNSSGQAEATAATNPLAGPPSTSDSQSSTGGDQAK